MKESIEFERPEGLPKGTVPAVFFVAPSAEVSDHHGTFNPDGSFDCTRTLTLTVDVTVSQLRAVAAWPVIPPSDSDRVERVVSGRVVAAAVAKLAEIGGES